MRALLILVVTGAAWGDASTPSTGGRSRLGPVPIDSLFLGVDARGVLALIRRSAYALPAPSGPLTLVQCRVMLYDATAAIVLDAWQQPIRVRGRVPVSGDWTSRSTGAEADWFKRTVPPAAGCDDVVAIVRASRSWSPPIPAGPLAGDWELCADSDEWQLRVDSEAQPAKPHGNLEMHQVGNCYRSEEPVRPFAWPGSKALILGRRRFVVAPSGWHLRRWR
jgi:hypothetical protein